MKKIVYNIKKINYPKRHLTIVNVAIFLCSIIFFTNMFCYLQINIPADTTSYWNDNATSLTASEDGIYKVSTPNQLAYMFFILLPSKTPDSTIKMQLQKDINLIDYYWNFTSINCNLEFDGKNHCIKGLKCTNNNVTNNSYYFGLISQSSNGNINIKNTNIECNLKDTYLLSTGAFIGYKTNGNLYIENCKAFGNININTGPVTYLNIGGLVGFAKNLDIINCSNYVNIISSIQISSYADNFVAGGLVGKIIDSCKISLCSNLGNISGNFEYTGGLIGCGMGLNLNTAKCFNSGNINSNFSCRVGTTIKYGTAGGLVGHIKSMANSIISFVYNTGNISSNGYCGGIVGNTDCKLSFSNLYNSGDVKAELNISKNVNSVSLNTIENHNFNYNGATLRIDSAKVNSNLTSVPRDVSIIGDDSKISNKNNVYSVQPTCYKDVTPLDDTKINITIKFSLLKNNNVLQTLTKTTPIVTKYDLIHYHYNADKYQFTVEHPKITRATNDKYYSLLTKLAGVSVYINKIGNTAYRISPYFDPPHMNVSGTDYDRYIIMSFVTCNNYKITYETLQNIKAATFDGDIFGTKNYICNGLPVIKDLYWADWSE